MESGNWWFFVPPFGGKEIFLEEGGESLEMVPSLNASPDWIEGLAEMVRAKL